MQKKIEYETIQLEFCMETFNPKAKEHSQAKKAKKPSGRRRWRSN